MDRDLCFGVDIWRQCDETAIFALDRLLATFPLALADTGAGRRHRRH